MKIFLFSIILLSLTVLAFADVNWYNLRGATIQWDAVTHDIDNDPISGIQYEVLMANTVEGKANYQIVARTPNTTASIVLPDKGSWYVGVRANLDEMMSDINWADEPAYQEGYELFGLRWGSPPKTPKNIRR